MERVSRSFLSKRGLERSIRSGRLRAVRLNACPAPAGDLAVVAAEQDVGCRGAPLGGCVGRGLEELAMGGREGVVAGALGVARTPGEAGHGLR